MKQEAPVHVNLPHLSLPMQKSQYSCFFIIGWKQESKFAKVICQQPTYIICEY